MKEVLSRWRPSGKEKKERERETNGKTNGKGRKGREKKIIEEGRRIKEGGGKEAQGDGGQSTSLDGDLRLGAALSSLNILADLISPALFQR